LIKKLQERQVEENQMFVENQEEINQMITKMQSISLPLPSKFKDDSSQGSAISQQKKQERQPKAIPNFRQTNPPTPTPPMKLKPLPWKTNIRTTSQVSSTHSLVSATQISDDENDPSDHENNNDFMEKIQLNRQSMRSVRKESYKHMFGLKQQTASKLDSLVNHKEYTSESKFTAKIAEITSFLNEKAEELAWI